MPSAPQDRPLRIAVAGAGLIGREHIRVIMDTSAADCCLAGIVDPAPAAAQLAQQCAVPHWHDLDELLAQQSLDSVDAVVVATPNATHHGHALQCLQAGLPILLEKPIATTVAQAEDIVRCMEQTNGTVLIGHHRAHSPLMRQAREIILQGQLGQLVAVQGSALFFKPDGYFVAAPWRTQTGGGPVALNLIHEIHNLRMLCGEIVAVQAFASHATRGFAVEDTAAINLRFANGALGSFILSDTAASARSWEQTARENPAYASYDDEDCYHIAGTFGSLSIPSFRLKVWHHAKERSWWLPFACNTQLVQRHDPLVLQMQHFVQVARGQAQALVSAHDGLNNLRVTEAVMQAARSGKLVEIP